MTAKDMTDAALTFIEHATAALSPPWVKEYLSERPELHNRLLIATEELRLALLPKGETDG